MRWYFQCVHSMPREPAHIRFIPHRARFFQPRVGAKVKEEKQEINIRNASKYANARTRKRHAIV